MCSRIFSAAALALAVAHGAEARAQDAMAKATAEALFADGTRLVARGDYRAACPKLAASQRLDPGVGTGLYLADCYERLGLVASAWAEFRSASAAARAAGSGEREREQVAADRAKALESKLSLLVINTS